MDSHPASLPMRQDALALLRQDMQEIELLFENLRQSGEEGAPAAARRDSMQRLGVRLRVRQQLQAELLYPALNDKGAALASVQPRKDQIARRVASLARQTRDKGQLIEELEALAREVAELAAFEEEQIPPRAIGVDLDDLGARLARRRDDLLKDLPAD